MTDRIRSFVPCYDVYESSAATASGSCRPVHRQRPPMAKAENFAGVSDDGERVFFTSR